jgi:enamine deaminase RidA (YjgF/YER057c/UK114 family)
LIERQVVNPAAGFAEAVVIPGPGGRTVYLSGNVGFDEEGNIVPGGIEAETRATFANFERTLERAGGTLDDIVKIQAFIVDLEDYAGYAKVRQEIFADRLPASSTVQVSGFVVDARIEIEGVAFIADS